MNVLFLTLLSFNSLQEKNIYTDLLREFVKNGHEVFVVSPSEKRENMPTHVVNEDHTTILRIQIGNIQKNNFIEKGISTVMIEPTFKKAIREHFSNVKFDLILYSTPPITLVSAVEYVKNRDGAKTYLLLKDIFPQNAVDIGAIAKTGVKGFLYKYFRRQEKKLYHISDRIGCMSQANVDYIIKHNPEVNPSIVEVCPNSIDVIDKSVDIETRKTIRIKYQIPQDKKVFVYGGNLGKLQGIPFLIKCLKKCQDVDDAYFLIVGDGTEYGALKNYIETEKPKNVKLMRRLPRDDYDTMVGGCDVGLIFLDYRFTIPNFPSRLLSYMEAKIPVLAATDTCTDIGKVITEGGFGWWCKSNDADRFREIVFDICNNSRLMDPNVEFEYLNKEYRTDKAYEIIVE